MTSKMKLPKGSKQYCEAPRRTSLKPCWRWASWVKPFDKNEVTYVCSIHAEE